jgi:hypothetical protein
MICRDTKKVFKQFVDGTGRVFTTVKHDIENGYSLDLYIKDISNKVGMDKYVEHTALLAEDIFNACKDRKEQTGDEFSYFPIKVLRGIFMKSMLAGLKIFGENNDIKLN